MRDRFHRGGMRPWLGAWFVTFTSMFSVGYAR